MESAIKEIDDILPTYNRYIEVKRAYQLGNTTEDSVMQSLDHVCGEIKDLIDTLYSGTDLYKERRSIQNLIKSLEIQYL